MSAQDEIDALYEMIRNSSPLPQQPPRPAQFVCTKCHVVFDGDDNMHATCPRCGANYSNFSTPLMRCGTFALAYWMTDNPTVQFEQVEKQK